MTGQSGYEEEEEQQEKQEAGQEPQPGESSQAGGQQEPRSGAAAWPEGAGATLAAPAPLRTDSPQLPSAFLARSLAPANSASTAQHHHHHQQ